MGVESGIVSIVDGVCSMAGWKTIEYNRAPNFSSSDIPGGTGGAAGNNDWRGMYRQYGHTPVHFPGDSIDFAGLVDSSNGVEGTGIIDRITMVCNVEAGNELDSIVEFSGNDNTGLTAGTPAAARGATPTMYSAIGRKVVWDSADVNIRWWRLVLSAANRPYVDTSTLGNVMRRPGNIKGQFEYAVYENDRTNLPNRGAIARVDFYCESDKFWRLDWGLVTQVPDYGGDHEGALNVEAKVRGMWTAQDGTSKGSITNPAGTIKWQDGSVV